MSDAEIDDYLSHPLVAYDDNNALELINTQFWVATIRNGTQAWANFRRTGYPALSPNLYNNLLSGGFIRRLSYPDYELAQNRDNYQNAVNAIGGQDNLTTRVFWDVQ